MSCDDHIKAWLSRGRPKRTTAEITRLFGICSTCPEFRGGRCTVERCPINRSPRPLQNMLAMGHRSCPLGKWSRLSSLADVTACITAWERPDALERLLASLRHYYPQLRVDVEDTGGNLSAGRNRLAARCTTPFYLMLEDDMEFSLATRLESLLKILAADDELAGVGGRVLPTAAWHHNFDLFRGQCGAVPSWHEWRVVDGAAYQPCELICNFGIFRTDFLRRNLWDENLPINEHRDWYWRATRSGDHRFGYCPSVEIVNHRDRPTDTFKQARGRRFDHYLAEKHGFEFIRPAAALADPRCLVVLTIGHENSTITMQQLQALGWQLGAADDDYAEHVRIRELCWSARKTGQLNVAQATRVLAGLRKPWAIKCPVFCETLHLWLPVLSPYRPTLLRITKDRAAVEASFVRRGEEMPQRRFFMADRHFAQWPWAKLAVDAEQVAAAVRMFAT